MDSIVSGRRRHARGFTLPELMVVVVIVMLMAGFSTVSLGRLRHAARVDALARSLYGASLQAHAEAVGDGYQRRIACTARGCDYEIASRPGMAAPPRWSSVGSAAEGSNDAVVWALAAATQVRPTDPGAGPLRSPRAITFFPDGTSTPATIYLADVNRLAHRKLYLFPATGMPRLVDRW